jgi:hypothetical protein
MQGGELLPYAVERGLTCSMGRILDGLGLVNTVWLQLYCYSTRKVAYKGFIQNRLISTMQPGNMRLRLHSLALVTGH